MPIALAPGAVGSPDDGWSLVPASLQGVHAQPYAIPRDGLVTFLVEWLRAREDQN